MKLKTFYIWAVVFAVAISFSAWFAYKNIYQKPDSVNAPTVVVEAPPAEPAVVATPFINNNPQMTCDEQPEYKQWRRELARIVNDRHTRQNKKKEFLAKLEKWRKAHGIPVSLGVDSAQAINQQIVFNNCRPSCNGKVHQVFVSQVIQNKTIEVLNKKGKLAKVPLRTSGLEVLTIDELNKKGIPFRSWFMPIDDGSLFIKGNDLYLTLDVEDVWLKVSAKGQWSLSLSDKKAQKLEKVDPLTVPGCVADEGCYVTADKKRAFKVPIYCH